MVCAAQRFCATETPPPFIVPAGPASAPVDSLLQPPVKSPPYVWIASGILFAAATVWINYEVMASESSGLWLTPSVLDTLTVPYPSMVVDEVVYVPDVYWVPLLLWE